MMFCYRLMHWQGSESKVRRWQRSFGGSARLWKNWFVWDAATGKRDNI